MIKIISPTGKTIRGVDAWGSGAFGAARENYTHRGVDFLADVAQEVVSPATLVVVREARPYPPPWAYGGILLQNRLFTVKMFYLEVDAKFLRPGHIVAEGEPIGHAQDITAKGPYRGMENHIHLEIEINSFNLLLAPEDTFKDAAFHCYLDPSICLRG